MSIDMHLRYDVRRMKNIHSRTGLLPIFSIETKIKISDLQNVSEVKQLWQQSGLILDIYNIPDWNTEL